MTFRYGVAALVAWLVARGPVAAAQAAGGDTLEVGDRVELEVAGDSTFTHVFTVGEGPALILPGIGALSVAGVRRADVQPFLQRALAKYLVTPDVHARALVRLSILGEVSHPGFYPVPADATVGDALMLAGGPTQYARLDDADVERAGAPIVSRAALRQAIAAGRTVDALHLRSGDAIVVPRRRDALATAQIVGILVGLPVAILAATKMF